MSKSVPDHLNPTALGPNRGDPWRRNAAACNSSERDRHDGGSDTIEAASEAQTVEWVAAAKGGHEVRTRRRGVMVKVVTLVVMAFSWPADSSATDRLFAADEILDLTFSGPLTRLSRDPAPGAEYTGSIELGNGQMIPVTFSKFGISRLSACRVPCLKINVDQDLARGTPFEGHGTLRLVTPCFFGSRYDSFILLEYLAYKSYEVIAEPALRVRLVSCRFRDVERPASEEIGLSFFLEDIGEAASRCGKQWLDIPSQSIGDLDPTQVTVLSLFQLMVGNTDWSVLSCHPGERCCHNVAVLGAEGDRFNTLLPFDFDYAGLVDAPYALPDEQLKIRRVTQRLYRGFCVHNDRLPAAIVLFNEKRPALEMLFSNDELPDPKARQRAMKYITSFYDTINDHRKVKSRILGDCR